MFKLLRAASGVDFTYYKKSTIKRRVARRMALQKIEPLSAYLKYLEGNRAELDALYQDILIHVTSFFREPGVFQALQNAIFPKVLAGKTAGDAVRIWIPGCSTGEEVYSIAMCLLENLGNGATATPIQIFGTDISEQAIEKARTGVYSENVLAHVSQERLRRFFERVDGHHQVNTAVRDVCIFARHDLTNDPPFSRLDLISCRNVLIYLEPVLQKKVLASFHYALRDTGCLLLGKSETLGAFPDLFALVDKKHKFFVKKVAPAGIAYQGPATYEKSVPHGRVLQAEAARFDIDKEADRVVWERYAHAGLVVNDELQILHFRGDTGPYLQPTPGRATLSLLKMLREELVLEMRAAIQKARKMGTAVRREAIRLKHNGGFRNVAVEVRPLMSPSKSERYFLVLFEDSGHPGEPPAQPQPAGRKRRRAEDREVLRLGNELAQTKEYLQAVIQEHETTNEELKSANEEALSSMEELQSTNEELETAKEELQSSNEELITLNEQLQNRNAELALLSDDLNNVLSGVNIPILMLGGDRRIRRFTPTAEKLLHLLPGDVSRPIDDIRLGVDSPDLNELIATVLGGQEIQREVRAEEGRWYSVRMCPYRTREQKIDGVLMAFLDIHELKQIQEALRKEGNFISAVLDAAKDLLVIVLDREERIVHFNRVCRELTGYSLEEAKGRRSSDFLLIPEEISGVRASFEELLRGARPTKATFHWVSKDGQRRLIAWSNNVALGSDASVEYVIRTGVDITDRREAEERVRESQATVEALLETAAQAILAVNKEGEIVLVNATAATMFGYGRQEMIGHPLENLVPSRLRERHGLHRAEYFSQPRSRPMSVGLDLAGLHKDGTQFPVEISLSQVEGRDGALAVAFVTDITERKRVEDALRESEATARASQEQLRDLTGRILTAQEEERRRVSRDLHDDLNQRLALLAVDVAVLEELLPDSAGGIRDRLQSLGTRLSALSDDVRRTAYQLHPSVLEHLGLVAALESYCTDFSKQEGLKVTFRKRRVPKDIPQGVALCLYRVVQECLRNAAKHSGAARASIMLMGTQDQVLLTIADNGRGFNLAVARGKGGLGIISMEERVRAAGGSLTIETRSGDGTRVAIRIPLGTAPHESTTSAAR